jgi:glycosyltransferase involved in cell wall biosynthesis
MEFVTVYIPTKNRLKLLKRAIQSVNSQSYKWIELIVVDDGSTDGTVEFLQAEMVQGNLRAFFHHASLGACAARNRAIENARGYFATGLDDDDYFTNPKRIEKFVDEWNNSKSNIGGLFDSIIASTVYGNMTRHEKKIVSYESLRQGNAVGSQIFAPRSHYIIAGLFDPNMPAWQDWDMWLRVAEKFGHFININCNSYLADEIHDAERITTRDEAKIRSAMQQLRRKITDISLREKSSLIISMYGYPQVKPQLREIAILASALRVKSVIFAFRKIFL